MSGSVCTLKPGGVGKFRGRKTTSSRMGGSYATCPREHPERSWILNADVGALRLRRFQGSLRSGSGWNLVVRAPIRSRGYPRRRKAAFDSPVPIFEQRDEARWRRTGNATNEIKRVWKSVDGWKAREIRAEISMVSILFRVPQGCQK